MELTRAPGGRAYDRGTVPKCGPTIVTIVRLGLADVSRGYPDLPAAVTHSMIQLLNLRKLSGS